MRVLAIFVILYNRTLLDGVEGCSALRISHWAELAAICNPGALVRRTRTGRRHKSGRRQIRSVAPEGTCDLAGNWLFISLELTSSRGVKPFITLPFASVSF